MGHRIEMEQRENKVIILRNNWVTRLVFYLRQHRLVGSHMTLELIALKLVSVFTPWKKQFNCDSLSKKSHWGRKRKVEILIVVSLFYSFKHVVLIHKLLYVYQKYHEFRWNIYPKSWVLPFICYHFGRFYETQLSYLE